MMCRGRGSGTPNAMAKCSGVPTSLGMAPRPFAFSCSSPMKFGEPLPPGPREGRGREVGGGGGTLHLRALGASEKWWRTCASVSKLPANTITFEEGVRGRGLCRWVFWPSNKRLKMKSTGRHSFSLKTICLAAAPQPFTQFKSDGGGFKGPMDEFLRAGPSVALRRGYADGEEEGPCLRFKSTLVVRMMACSASTSPVGGRVCGGRAQRSG